VGAAALRRSGCPDAGKYPARGIAYGIVARLAVAIAMRRGAASDFGRSDIPIPTSGR